MGSANTNYELKLAILGDNVLLIHGELYRKEAIARGYSHSYSFTSFTLLHKVVLILHKVLIRIVLFGSFHHSSAATCSNLGLMLWFEIFHRLQ